MSRTIRLTPQQRTAAERDRQEGFLWKVRRRAQALLLLHQGAFTTEIAEQLEVHRNSVYLGDPGQRPDPPCPGRPGQTAPMGRKGPRVFLPTALEPGVEPEIV